MKRAIGRGMLAGGALGLALTCSASAGGYQQVQAASDADILIVAGKLRKVRILYAATGNTLARCDVRTDSDARVIDQMMCSILAGCLADNAIAVPLATKCMNARVDELEATAGSGTVSTGSSVPDQWLATGYEAAKSLRDEPMTASIGGVRPGNWVFTELAQGRDRRGRTGPSLLQWRMCLRADQARDGLARLLEPPSYTSGVRLSLPADCRNWNLRAKDGAFAGAMACRAPTGALANGTIRGDTKGDTIVFRRVRSWKKKGDWAEATFDTTAHREGDCVAM